MERSEQETPGARANTNEWKRVKRKRGELIELSDSSKVEDGLGTGSQTSTNENKYFPEWFGDDGDDAHENHGSTEGVRNGESGNGESGPRAPVRARSPARKDTEKGNPLNEGTPK